MLREWKTTSRLGQRPRSQHDGTKVWVRNDSYVTVPAFGILGLGDPLVFPSNDPFAAHQRPAFAGEEPDVDDHAGKWVALTEPIAYGAIGRGILVGHAVVRVYVTATTDKFCDVIPAETIGGYTVYLGTGPRGSRILWLDPTAEAGAFAWAVVNVGSSGDAVLWGKLDADLAYDDTTGVAFSIWELNDSNTWEDTDENIDLVFPPFELAHAMVPSGVKIEVTNRGGKWFVSQFPKVYEGTLAGALAASGTATVTVGGDSFTGCKAGNTQTDTIPISSAVTITLKSDGYYYVTLAPC